MIPSQTPLPKIPLSSWVETLVNRTQMHLHGFLGLISQSGTSVNGVLVDVSLTIPPLVMVVVFVLIAWLARSWRLAAGTAIIFLLIISMGQWANAMETLILVTLATVIAFIFTIPLGVWAARNKHVNALVRPILDLMQAMPVFVYLIPSVLFFSIGVVPDMLATLIFAMPLGVRMIELGIKQADKETVEAGRSFGATDWQTLRDIQLPLAVSTVMTGVNQVIMLALSMAVIAGMVGADGLGKEVVKVLVMIDIAKGIEAGLSVVSLAIFLSRVIAVLGAPREEDLLLSFLERR